MLTASSLAEIPGLHHGFFTRSGGHSSGLYDSLNCGLGSGDDRKVVLKNRATCAEALGASPNHMVTVHQEHTAKAVTAIEPWTPEDAPVADGMATDQPGLALGVLAADCVPVLFADADAHVVGAAHAGWKGAFTGVLETTIERMVELGARRPSIVAAIGPCIGAKSYEVGPEFIETFISANPDNAAFFAASAREGHSYFDIGSYVQTRLSVAGVLSVERIIADTYVEPDRFFSYRRSCHREEPDYGRQLSGICWKS